MRELRELTLPQILVEERAREANRVQKVLETANIKLGDVATDVVGVSGRAMIEAMIEGERDTARMAELAKRSLGKKRDALQEARGPRGPRRCVLPRLATAAASRGIVKIDVPGILLKSCEASALDRRTVDGAARPSRDTVVADRPSRAGRPGQPVAGEGRTARPRRPRRRSFGVRPHEAPAVPPFGIDPRCESSAVQGGQLIRWNQ